MAFEKSARPLARCIQCTKHDHRRPAPPELCGEGIARGGRGEPLDVYRGGGYGERFGRGEHGGEKARRAAHVQVGVRVQAGEEGAHVEALELRNRVRLTLEDDHVGIWPDTQDRQDREDPR